MVRYAGGGPPLNDTTGRSILFAGLGTAKLQFPRRASRSPPRRPRLVDGAGK